MLTIDEFRKLPRPEQEERYKELSDHDKFLARISEYNPPEVISELQEEDLTEEQKRQNDEFLKWAQTQDP